MKKQTDIPSADNNVDAIVRAAADWCMLIHSDECSPADQVAFNQWLKQDPAHEQAYNKIRQVWGLSEQLTPTISSPWAQANTSPKTTQPLPIAAKTPYWPWQSIAWAVSLASILLVTLGYLGWTLNCVPNEYHRYSTEQARSHVILPDGTRVEMNLNTQISYANYRDRRHVSINGNGEAFFNVSHNTKHPFKISAANGTITVTGTAFNVWKYGKDVAVTVTEGSVIVQNGKDTVHLTPGMKAEYTAKYTLKVSFGDLDQALAWQSGKLILDDQPLAKAIPQIARYLDESIILTDATVANLRIGGIYNTENLDDLITTLPQILPLSIKKRFWSGIEISSHPH